MSTRDSSAVSSVEAGCRTFYSEDLHHSQRIEGLTIRNPFRA
jgi:predicted nucleic acid-binding protein